MKRQGVIAAWHDREISAGVDRAGAIDENFKSADIILLLVSASFLGSDYCYDLVKRAVERHKAGEVRVIPIILRPVDWTGEPFGDLQVLPKNAKPVTTWGNRDEAFVDITQSLRKAAYEIAESRNNQRLKLNSIVREVVSLDNNQKVLVDSGLSDTASQAAQASSSTSNEQPDISSESFYIERPPIEIRCYKAIVKPGACIRIKAPWQMGKTALLRQILDHAQNQGYNVVRLSFQQANTQVLNNLNSLLQWLCANTARKLGLDATNLTKYWKNDLNSTDSCTDYFELYLLQNTTAPLVLGLDEVDLLFQSSEVASDFLGLLRTWHEESKINPIWGKFRLVITHSFEFTSSPNINQSPFNAGVPIELVTFNQSQVAELAHLHKLNFSLQQIEQLMSLVGGHPHLVQSAFEYIASEILTLDELLQVAISSESPFHDHLNHYLVYLENYPELKAEMKQLVSVSDPVNLSSSATFKLRSLGLIKSDGNFSSPACELYRRYFQKHL